MAGFIIKNFSPVGSNARAGNAPQVFSYITVDSFNNVKARAYFNELKGVLRRGDWIIITYNVDASTGRVVVFVLSDGQSPAIMGATVNDGGTATYVVGETISPIFVDGTVIQRPTSNITQVNAGVVTNIFLMDTGLFDSQDIPTTLTGLATTGGSGSGLLLDVTLTNETPQAGFLGDIMVSGLDIAAG